MTGCLRLFGCGGFGALGQTLQLGLVLDEVLISVGLGYDVVAELQAQQSKLLVDLHQAGFLLGIELGTVVDKRLVGLGEQSHLFRRQTERLTLVIDGLHALEEGLVQQDAIVQVAQEGRYLLCDLVPLVIAVSLQHVEEDAGDAVELQTGAVQRYDGVFKRGLLAVVVDSVHLGFLLLDSCLKSRHEFLQFDLVECRYGIRSRAFILARTSN